MDIPYLLTQVKMQAKEPPRRNMLYMRMINQLLDPDLAIARGSQTLEEELGEEGVSPKPTPVRSTQVEMSKLLESEAAQLRRPSLEIQVLLATWDLSRRVEMDTTNAGVATLALPGGPCSSVVAPSKPDLREAVDDLITLMKHPVCLDEIIFEADGLDLAFPLLYEIWKVHTLQAMDVVTSVVSVPVHVIKHHLNVDRPCEIDSRVIPLIPVPGHASFPGGHAATTFALAVVLGAIMGATEEQQTTLDHIALRIARNRERAGLHTRLDTDEGKKLGRLMGHWMVDVAQKAEFKPQAWGVLFAEAANEWKKKEAGVLSTRRLEWRAEFPTRGSFVAHKHRPGGLS